MDFRSPSSRPPSARPPTRQQQRPGTANVRRPKTAGRNSERPPLSQQFQIMANRPKSRIGLTSEAIDDSAAQRPMTGMARGGDGIGTKSPSELAADSLRSASRRGLRSAASRQPNALLRTAGGGKAVNQQQRPITQQGISGADKPVPGSRMASRMGTVMRGRTVADKSYFIGLLNNQLNALENEVVSLGFELEKAEKGKENLLAYEQRAEEQANELKQLQGTLADYNTIIDRQNTDSNLRALEGEILEANRTNQEMVDRVEKTFRERKQKEETASELEERIGRIKAENATKMNEMGNELEEEFGRVTSEAEQLADQLAKRQAQLEEIGRRKEQLDMALANSPLKQQTMMLEEQLQELRERRAAIVSELNAEETPEAQRDHFAQRIQRDNEEIAQMQTQLQETKERMAQAQEELQEMQNEFEVLAGGKSDKFRELKGREQQMDTFLENFELSKSQREEHIGTISAQIVRQLQLISLNCRHLELAVANVSGLDESVLAMGSAGVSAAELQQLHLRLQEELISLDQHQILLSNEFDSMRSKQTEIEAELGKMANLEMIKAEFGAKGRELEAKKVQVDEELLRTETELAVLREQRETAEKRTEKNAQMAKLRQMKQTVDELEEGKAATEEKTKEQMAKYDFESAKQKTLQKRTEFNEMLTNGTMNSSSNSRTKNAK
ncbi:hypothetical protein niasHS_002556 [Heterodera schachtii]|uniref:Uncharacterized protein n=1 Tax=Heterodera schachtii TaxID=97005 RepID=A0ABD2KKA0_HETSC